MSANESNPPPKLLQNYPHLLHDERALFKEFITKFPTEFDRFDFDVHIGAGVMPKAPPNDPYAHNFKTLTQKRIDAIGWVGSLPTLIEIRSAATLEVIGKLIGYGRLWERENPMTPAPELALICRTIGPDDLFVAYDKRVTVYEI